MKNQILLALSVFALTSCASKTADVEQNSYKTKSKIAMQRVKDTKPLAKQDLVSREAMQYAMLDKMNVREDRQRREFNRIQEQQRRDFEKTQDKNRDEFLLAHKDNTERLNSMVEQITESTNEFVEIGKQTQAKINLETKAMSTENADFKRKFRMIAAKIDDNTQMQSRYFNEMRTSIENKLAFDEARLEREREKENTIRGVVENMYADQDSALTQFYTAEKEGMLPASKWVALEDAPITVHVENEKFEDLMLRAVNNAAVHSGPWNLKWKLKKENEILLYTKFSLDVETNFGEFVSNVKKYIVNYNGVKLYFRVFKEKRVLIVSDS